MVNFYEFFCGAFCMTHTCVIGSEWVNDEYCIIFEMSQTSE